MITASVWLVKLLLAHLLTDFVLQPKSWVENRSQKHFRSVKLYLHGLVTAAMAWALIGWQYWLVALVILFSHTLIDGWKSYQKPTLTYFLTDQILHLLVIFICWYVLFIRWEDVQQQFGHYQSNIRFWKTIAAFVFLTSPSGILIGQMTSQWRSKIENAESLANAGKWIGMIERVIILVFVLFDQFSAIGLLVAAKGIIRFNEKDRQEIKTEYLVIGTLMSLVVAILTGLAVKLL